MGSLGSVNTSFWIMRCVVASVLILTLYTGVTADEEVETIDLYKMAGLFRSEYDYSKAAKADDQALNYLSEQDQLLVAQAEEELEYIDELDMDEEDDPEQVLEVKTRAVTTSYTKNQLANAIKRC